MIAFRVPFSFVGISEVGGSLRKVIMDVTFRFFALAHVPVSVPRSFQPLNELFLPLAESDAVLPMFGLCLQHAFMIWFRSANSHTGPQLHRCIRGRTDGSIRLRAPSSKNRLHLAGRPQMSTRPSIMGPMGSSPPSDRHAAELTLLSVVDAIAATLCCWRSGKPI